MYRARQGFTLIELSVVLAIIGLLVGGVLAGQALIKSAELKSVTRDAQQYQSAIINFRGQYRALPGDMLNAARLWGSAGGAVTDGTNPTCLALTAASTDSKTCNGDGNGIIGNGGSPSTAAVEQWRSWQHLSNAGLIQGGYPGVSDAGALTPGYNVPASRYAKTAGWSLYGFSTVTGYFFPGSQGNALFFGNKTGTTVTEGGIMKPEDAYAIDLKMDDGSPSTGQIITFMNGRASTPDCTAADVTKYKLTDTGAGCSLIFRLKRDG